VRRILLVQLAALALGGGAAQATPARGGELTVLAAGDVDYLDPGQTYYAFGYMVQNATQRTLYAFAPGDSLPRPDLAAGEPQISADLKTVTVHLRAGVRYAPPVNRDVVAGDIVYAFARARTRALDNPYVRAYFAGVTVTAPDPSTLVLHMKRPRAVSVAAALVMPVTAPVPPEYAGKLDAHRFSHYERAPAFTGPYMVAARTPGRSITLTRNPNWDPATDFRPAYADRIFISEGYADLAASSRRILAGSGLLQGDAIPPGAIVRDALAQRPAQVARVPGMGTRWVALNTRIAPLNDLNIRKGILAGMDREALRRSRGGALNGEIATHFLPPGFPGYEQGGAAGGTGVDYLASPRGNRALARRYFRRASALARRAMRHRRLLAVGTNADPGLRTAREAVRQLRRLGFHIRLKITDQDRLYADFCSRPRARVAVCPNVGFFEDFADPESMLRPTFDGTMITPVNNSNWSLLDDRGLNRSMAAADQLPAGPDRLAAWGDIDRRIVGRAPGVPWLWDIDNLLESADVEGAANPYSTTWDLSFSGRR
jgi:peptide/nickel transport system substrate-binding protein